jgi:tryptophan-rich sensory protein
MKLRDILKLIIAVLIVEFAGVIGSFFTMPSISGWYSTLAKPVLNPPNWIFAPVWTTLYALMGVAAFLIWRHGLRQRRIKVALTIFSVQLVLNILWSIIFFGFQDPFLAFIEVIILWLAIVWTIFVFYKISRLAACLLMPYILWVSFAGYLTYSIWVLN